MSLIKRFYGRADGQDLIEYALLASAVSVVAVVILSSLGLKVSTRLDTIGAAISDSGTSGGTGTGTGTGTGSGTGTGTGSGSTGTGSGSTGSGNGNGNGNGGKKG